MVGGGEWLTIGEIAAELRVSDSTARDYLDAGRLDDPVKAARLPSGHRRAHQDSVERLKREMYGDNHSSSVGPDAARSVGPQSRQTSAETADDPPGDG